MRVLFATTVLPHGQTTGGEIASYAIAEALSRAGHDVCVLGYQRGPDEALPAGYVSAGVRPIETSQSGMHALWWMLAAIVSGRPYVVQKFKSGAYRQAFRRLCAERDIEFVVLDHVQMTWLLGDIGSRKCVLVAHNVEADLYQDEYMRAGVGSLKRYLLGRDASLLRGVEAKAATKSDRVWTFTEEERTAFASLANDSGKVVRLDIPSSRAQVAADLPPIADVGLLGTWSWDVNRHGLEWFLGEVLPRLPSTIKVAVGGRGSQIAEGYGPNVVSLGFVTDPAEFFSRVSVLAIPTVSGRGVQIKTIEAVSSGCATVVTTLGARGLGDLPDYVHVADGSSEFATQLVAARSTPLDSRHVAGANWSAERHRQFDGAIARSVSELADR